MLRLTRLTGSRRRTGSQSGARHGPGMPHEIQIDLGANYLGAPVSSGLLISNPADKRLQQVTFGVVQGRYVRLRALSEVNGGPWTDIAELNVLGN
jgi:hypothetical protein